jgi:hypothetical protein
MTVINDPNGTYAGVTAENRLQTYSVIEQEARHANLEGNAYSIVFEADPNGTDIDFFYLKNTSENLRHRC